MAMVTMAERRQQLHSSLAMVETALVSCEKLEPRRVFNRRHRQMEN